MNGKKVLVFGGSGFLGKYMVSELIERGYSVTIYDKRAIKEGSSSHVKFISGDILDIYKVNQAVSEADIVYNLAGIADIEECIKEPLDAIRHNILGNTIILDACVKNNIERFVFSSSVYAHSKSGGIYSSTKKASEDIIKNYGKHYGLKYTILQYGTLYGVGVGEENSIYRYLKQALIDKKIKYAGDGSETREYIHVIDAAKLGVEILNNEYENKIVIVTGQHPTKVRDLFEMIKEILGEDIEIEYSSEMPNWKTESHYKITPYSYNKDMPYKLTTNLHVELGKGILQLLDSIEEELKNPVKEINEKQKTREHSFEDEKFTIGVDFDGVIHKNSKGFYDGTIYDEPVEDVKEALEILSKNFKIVIYTTKAKPDRPLVTGKTGKELVWDWLKKYNLDSYVQDITSEKPRAVFYIDDKAIMFKGWNETLKQIKETLDNQRKEMRF